MRGAEEIKMKANFEVSGLRNWLFQRQNYEGGLVLVQRGIKAIILGQLWLYLPVIQPLERLRQ